MVPFLISVVIAVLVPTAVILGIKNSSQNCNDECKSIPQESQPEPLESPEDLLVKFREALFTVDDALNSCSVRCPLGVLETLVLLDIILVDEKNKTEVENIFNGKNVLKNMDEFNKTFSALLVNHSYAFLNAKFISSVENDLNMKSQVELLNFDDPLTLTHINEIVEKDTEGNIKNLLTMPLNASDILVLLNVLHIRDAWNEHASQAQMDFSIQVTTNKVEAFSFYGKSFSYLLKDNVTFVEMRTEKGFTLLIRYKENEVSAITKDEYDAFYKEAAYTDVKTLKVPEVAITTTIDLLEKLSRQLPETLQKDFNISLSSDPVKVSTYIQKLVFKMDHTGLDASAVTAMTLRTTAAFRPEEPTLEIEIKGPFSFVLGYQKTPLFLGEISDWEQLKLS